jgi:hypothetical protein
MNRFSLRFAAFVLAVLAACPAAFAFDGASDEPGSHMNSLRSALAALYGLDLPPPVRTKSGSAPEYAWNPYRATDLMADAARDADWYFFANQAAHAQTPEFDYGKKRGPENLKAIESKALFEYVKFVDAWLKKARAAFTAGRVDEGLYYVGFLTHCYQDLWAHRGITNGMHKALLSRRRLDVDRDPAREAEMESRLADWLTAMPEMLGSEAARPYLDALLSNPVLARPSLAKRAKMLGRRRDIFWEGTMYAIFQGDPKSSLNYLEEIEWDADGLRAIILDPEAFALATALEKPEELAIFLESRGYSF